METKIAVVETKINSTLERLREHIQVFNGLRTTFTNVTVVLITLIFGVVSIFLGGLFWSDHKQDGKYIAVIQGQYETNAKIERVSYELAMLRAEINKANRKGAPGRGKP